MQKGAVQPPIQLAGKVHKQAPIIGLSANAQKEMRLDQPIIGRAANIRQDLTGAQPVSFTSPFMDYFLPSGFRFSINVLLQAYAIGDTCRLKPHIPRLCCNWEVLGL